MKIISYKESCKCNNMNILNKMQSKITKILNNSKKDILLKKNYSKQYILNNSPKTKRDSDKKNTKEKISKNKK